MNNNNDPRVINETIMVDTLVKPDYYKVYLTIGEVRKNVQTGKGKWSSMVVSLDTLKSVLRKKLDSLGFTQEIELVAVTDKMGANYNESSLLKQELYLIKIPAADDVIRLYKNVHFEGFTGMKAYPFYSQETLDLLENKLKNKATRKMNSQPSLDKRVTLTSGYIMNQNFMSFLQVINANYDINLEVKPITYSVYLQYER
jgi:hypothetical protein